MNSDFKDDELIDVKLARSDYKLLTTMLKEREAKNWLTAKVSSWWIFAVGGGALVLWNLGDKIILMMTGTVK